MKWLGIMKMPSWNLGQLWRRDLFHHMVFRNIHSSYDSSKANCCSTFQIHQYSAQQVARSFPFFYRFRYFMDRIAVIDQYGSWKYRDILWASCNLADKLVEKYGPKAKQNGLDRAKIALLCDSDASFFIGLFAGWIADAIVVPLYQKREISLEPVYCGIQDTGCSIVITTETYLDDITKWTLFKDIRIHLLNTKDFVNQAKEHFFFSKAFAAAEYKFLQKLWYHKDLDKDAIIWYISEDEQEGYAERGLILTFRNIMATINCEIKRGYWSVKDTTLYTPHFFWDQFGSVDRLVPLYFGGTCVILPEYCPKKVLKELLAFEGSMAISNSCPVTKFASTREVYSDILDFVDKDFSGKLKDLLKNVCTSVSMTYLGTGFYIPQRWFHTLGRKLRVTYRTARTGEIFTFMPHAYKLRNAFVYDLEGNIKPTVMGRIAIYHETGFDIVYTCIGSKVLKTAQSVHGFEGELQLKGDCISTKYLSDPDKTTDKYTYTHDGWLKTGHIASPNNCMIKVISPQNKCWLNTSQSLEKISGTVIYAILKHHPAIEQLDVFRRPNAKPNQTVAVAVVLKDGALLTLKEVHEHLLKSGALNERKALYPSVLLRLKSPPESKYGMDQKALVSILLHKDLHKEYDIEMIDP